MQRGLLRKLFGQRSKLRLLLGLAFRRVAGMSIRASSPGRAAIRVPFFGALSSLVMNHEETKVAKGRGVLIINLDSLSERNLFAIRSDSDYSSPRPRRGSSQ